MLLPGGVMNDGGSHSISTDTASAGLGSGSDAVVHMGDLLPHVAMDEPPSNLAAELPSSQSELSVSRDLWVAPPKCASLL